MVDVVDESPVDTCALLDVAASVVSPDPPPLALNAVEDQPPCAEPVDAVD